MSIAFCASALATLGFVCVSRTVNSSLRPSTPPLALISLTARSMPFFMLLPTDAPAPDSSSRPTIGIGWPCAATVADSVSAIEAARIRSADFIRAP